MIVDVVGRRGREDPELCQIHAIAEIDELLPRADDVVLALPLNKSTRQIIDARRLALMQTGARLVNVGRGALVDEAALLAAAQNGHLNAVALDVFEQEPLPAGHPFWAMDNVLVSPHMSGDLVGWRSRVADRFAANFRRWINGEPLADVVDIRDHGASAPALVKSTLPIPGAEPTAVRLLLGRASSLTGEYQLGTQRSRVPMRFSPETQQYRFPPVDPLEIV